MGEFPIARTPNYSFERQERERQKAKKLADKAAAKRQAREQAENSGQAPTAPSDDS